MAPLCLGGSTADHEPLSSNPNRLSHSVSQADVIARRTGKPLCRKLVVIGDGACGKTSLLNVFVNGSFPQCTFLAPEKTTELTSRAAPELSPPRPARKPKNLRLLLLSYEPTVFENHVKDVYVDDTPVELSLWDTAGQEDFDRLRSLSYADTHVVLLCFSVDQPTSLENVENKWIDEILELCPGVKLCLVALKCDLREDPATQAKLARYQQEPVGYDAGLMTARRIRASRYLECSAKMDRGVGEAFQEAARVAVSARRKGETRGSDNPNLKMGAKESWIDSCVVC